VKTGNGKDTDEWALENQYVAVVPVQFDFTSHKAMVLLKSWETNV
jgi:5'-nucleotidase